MNVLLITTDQQRADTIGAWGNPVIRTPILDRLAAQGTSFTGCRTQNPYCQPSRATMLTGEYPSRHGVTSNGIDLPADAAERSLPAHLGRAGFSTAIIGKAHFASTYPVFPTGKIESVEGSASVPADWHGPYFGFDHAELALFGHSIRLANLMGQWNWCFGPPPFGLHYARWLFRDGFDAGVERLRLMQPEASGGVWDGTQTWPSALPESEHPTTWIADRAIDWIGRQDGPFFAWVSFADPHHPMDPPRPWADLYDPADLDQVLWRHQPGDHDGKPGIHRAWARGQAGGPMEWANPGGQNLTRKQLCTMAAGYYGLISMLDHHIGRILDSLAERGILDDTLVIFTSDHGEFLGDHEMLFKGPLHYESLLRVPLIVRGPGFEPGAVVDDPVGLIDIAPTALSAAGVQVPENMQGAPLLDGPREHVLTENDHQMVIEFPLRTLTTKRYTLTTYLAQDGVGELYDREVDPLQLENRWDDPSYAAVRAELLATLAAVAPAQVRREPVVGVVA